MKWCVLFLGLATLSASPAAAQQRRAPVPAPAPAPRQVAPAPQQPQQPTGTPMPVRATARNLTAICSENQAACLAYVVGAVDAYVGTSVVNFGRAYVCIPQQVTNQQIANVAVAFMRAHPELQDMNAALVVIQGVSTSYPCR
jgi:hypothetical protein